MKVTSSVIKIAVSLLNLISEEQSFLNNTQSRIQNEEISLKYSRNHQWN